MIADGIKWANFKIGKCFVLIGKKLEKVFCKSDFAMGYGNSLGIPDLE